MGLTPELKAHVVQYVIQRGITEDQITPEILGDALKASLNKMDQAVIKVMDSRKIQNVFMEDIYTTIRAAA